MRIAVSGTHGSGKTTLIEDVVALRPGYGHMPEPYWELASAGVAFGDPPTIEDMAGQLDHSWKAIVGTRGEPDILYDRCPLDFLAYLEAMSEAAGDEWTPDGRQLARIETALGSLDLIVFLALSRPDEIAGAIEHPALRRAVDRRLRRILLDDELGLMAAAPRVLTISGPRAARAERLVRAIEAG